MKTKHAWLAGIIDGEGTITITRQRRYDYKSHPYSYRPEIHVTNTSNSMLLEVSEIIKKVTGKKVWIYQTDNREKRPVYRARLQDRNSCLILAKTLLPHLISKKSQALLLIDFLTGNKEKSETQAALIREMHESSS